MSICVRIWARPKPTQVGGHTKRKLSARRKPASTCESVWPGLCSVIFWSIESSFSRISRQNVLLTSAHKVNLGPLLWSQTCRHLQGQKSLLAWRCNVSELGRRNSSVQPPNHYPQLPEVLSRLPLIWHRCSLLQRPNCSPQVPWQLLQGSEPLVQSIFGGQIFGQSLPRLELRRPFFILTAGHFLHPVFPS